MDKSPFSFASLANLPLIEQLYQQYGKDPGSIDPSWRHFFEGLDFAAAVKKTPAAKMEGGGDLRVYELIQAYRSSGHLLASINPLNAQPPEKIPELELLRFGLQNDDLSKVFPTYGILKESTAPLSVLLEALKRIYCRTIGFEYMGCEEGLRAWLQQKIEQGRSAFSAEQKIEILDSLNKAELFESYLHRKYVGQTRFSIEGGETLIPLLARLFEKGAELGIEQSVIGMAHRGRLNVLVNLLDKPLKDIFAEFEGYLSPGQIESTGDVKYHKGLSSSFKTSSGKSVVLSLMPNPSHLESVDPVVEGQARALQEKMADKSRQNTVLPLLIHGDAAMAGQGVVYETMQFSKLNGYSTCGTMHVAINNQLGYTTLPKDDRSTEYCTDIAKTFRSPVFHVNAEDPEGCVYIALLALEVRQQFATDVFIDFNCYRKHGHNEGDEPHFTQPLEYQIIQQKKLIRELYAEQLIEEGVLDAAQAEAKIEEYKQVLVAAFEEAKNLVSQSPTAANVVTKSSEGLLTSFPTGVDAKTLTNIAEKFCQIPENFHLHPKLQKLFQDRLKMAKGEGKIDWGMGEYLAYGSLLWQGVHIRLTGQDCRRGTFNHRHAAWIDQENGERYFPLSHLKEGQGLFDVFNSPLSELACMGFEFGYSATWLDSLVIWEAQYGDFVNGAQIIIDQYINSSEQKWNQPSAITLLLPHAYEGQGPEHSSARMERFLQQSAQDNIQVVNCTTPAQIFHLLRRQGLRPMRKPLVVFTPKSYLRHPLCVSSIEECAQGSFQEVLDDPSNPSKPSKLYLCSGKIYYDLLQEKEKRKAEGMALIRVEQLYPLHTEKLKELFQKYRGFKECVWIQEEQSNMGAWEYIRPLIDELLDGGMRVRYIGRERSAATSVGVSLLHKKEVQKLMDEAFQ